jgi:DNA-binding transcriptional LysR family regulator
MASPASVTVQQLRHFVAVADVGKVSRAADRCHISQPSMTASLQNLEAAVGERLLLRRRDGLRLTLNGERFLRHAHAVLATLSEAVDEVRRPTDAMVGAVTLGATHTIAGYLLPSLIAGARKRFPGIVLTVVERERDDIEGDLLAARFDFAILLTSTLTRADELDCETLLCSPRCLWTSLDHPLALRDTVSLAEVAKHDYVILDMDGHVAITHAYWSRHGLRPRTVFTVKSVEGVRSLVGLGMGVTILSDLVFRDWSHDGKRIRRKTVTDAVPSMDIGLARRPHATLAPAADAVRQYMRSAIRDLVNSEQRYRSLGPDTKARASERDGVL